MRIVAITQARFGSTRLPGKVLKTIDGKTILEIHLNRVLQSKLITKLKVATTIEPDAGKIVKIASKLNVETFCGSIDDVLERFYLTALPENPDYIVRITSDCPLIDPAEIDKVIDICINGGYDYVSNGLEPTYPDGIDVEAFKFSALVKAYNEATLKSDREHVTPYIWRNSSVKGGKAYSSFSVKHHEDFSKYRITLDTLEDFHLIECLIQQIGTEKSWLEYIDFLNKHPEILKINKEHQRNEGYSSSLKKDLIE